MTDKFPDGTVIDKWFYESIDCDSISNLRQYVITDYNVFSDGKVYTREIQSVIDMAYDNGGGVVVVPCGEYITGALFFKKGVHLCVCKGATLKGSDDISDYPVMDTRIEGENCIYYPALINAYNADGFTMYGGGEIDGNGEKSWKAFWQRRKWNPSCTNKDEQRPRLVYVSDSSFVTISDLTLKNSHFWTTHLYRCNHTKIISCKFLSPHIGIKAPSTDAIDVDVCTDVLIKGCYFDVNDDGIALKGGKGPFADTLAENGMNERIIIDDCRFVFCHGCLTCGSEAIHNRNIIVRNSLLSGAATLLWLKMRPDTPQHYEYIRVENITGEAERFLSLYIWTQFFDLKGREDIPMSYADNVTMKDCNIKCKKFFDVTRDDKYFRLSDFTFKNLLISALDSTFDENAIDNVTVANVIFQ